MQRLLISLFVATIAPLVGVGGLLVASDSWADINPETEARQEWYRSYVPTGSPRTVRIAVVTGGGDRVKRAAVHETRQEIRITLVRTHSNLPGTSDGQLFCVEVRLRRSAGSRVRVDGATGRAPDRAKPRSPDAALREDTRSVSLKRGPCKRLRVNYY